MLYPGIEKKAEEILIKAEINSAPVNLKKVLNKLDISLKYPDLGENVSGVLVIKDKKATIGINPLESVVRQRFSIAHELGHYYLHGKNQDQLFIEEKKVLFRNEDSASGEHKKEREANAFAAALLMPKILLDAEIESRQLDVSHEDSIKKLAKTFNVSAVAMTYRITNLKLI